MGTSEITLNFYRDPHEPHGFHEHVVGFGFLAGEVGSTVVLRYALGHVHPAVHMPIRIGAARAPYAAIGTLPVRDLGDSLLGAVGKETGCWGGDPPRSTTFGSGIPDRVSFQA